MWVPFAFYNRGPPTRLDQAAGSSEDVHLRSASSLPFLPCYGEPLIG